MPRLGLGSIDLSATTGGGNSVTGIDDFFFESFTAGQMHPIQTVDRKNLVLQSETWDNASWTKNASTVEPNQIASPLDSSAFTADLLKEDNANAEHWVRSNNISASLGQTFTMSFYAKAKERTFIKANFLNSGVVSYNVWINLSNGAITSKNANLTVTTELIGSGFYRITLTAQAAATTLNLLVALATGDANNSYAGDGSSGVYVFGAQIEQDNFVSNYIRTVGSTVTVSTILNDTSNVWDFDGTDIMIAEDPEDEGFWEESYPDGASLPELVLNGDYADLGSELVTNGDFSTAGTLTNSSYSLGWISPDSGVSISSGVLNLTRVGSGGRAYASNGSNGNLAITSSKTYQLTYTITENTDNSTLQYHNGGAYISTSSSVPGTYTVTYVAAGTIFLFRNSGADTTIKLDNVSLKQVDPNNRWTLTGGASISDGKATVTGASGTTTIHVNPQNLLVEGTTYELTYTISNYSLSSGATAIINNNGSTIQSISGNGTFTAIFTHAISNGNLIFRATNGTNSYQLDNVSVKEYAIQPLDI